MFRLHSVKRYVASLLLMTVPIIGLSSAPASAYANATFENRTNHPVSGTVSYVGCRSDNYTIPAGTINPKTATITPAHSTVSARRGACLIKSITANLNGKAAQTYTSSGTGYVQFIVSATPTGGYRVDSLASLEREQANATGSPDRSMPSATPSSTSHERTPMQTP